MASEIEELRKEVSELREEVRFVKQVLREDWEFSDEVKRALEQSRDAPMSEYVELK